MNEVDDAVRTMLTARAETVPPSPVLLDGVHRRIRHHRTRRRALVGAAAAVVLLAAGGVAWSAERSDDRLVPADRPASSATAAPDQDSRGLVPGNPTVPAAPLAPGALPSGFPTPTLALDTKNSWIYTSTRPTAPNTALTIRISRTLLGATTGNGTTRTIAVGKSRGTLYTVTPEQMAIHRPYDAGTYYQSAFAELTYRHPSGIWVQIVAGHDDPGRRPLDVTADQLVAVAEGLVEAQRPVPDVLRFASVPEGLVVGSVWAGFGNGGPEVQFVSPRAGQKTSNPKANTHSGGGTPIMVTAGSPDDSSAVGVYQDLYPVRRTITAGPTAITVGKSDNNNGRSVYTARMSNGELVIVIAEDSLRLSDTEMARFVTGITPGPDYR